MRLRWLVTACACAISGCVVSDCVVSDCASARGEDAALAPAAVRACPRESRELLDEEREEARVEPSAFDLQSISPDALAPEAARAVETFLERWLRERGPEHVELALSLGWFESFDYQHDALDGGIELRTRGFPLGILPMAGVHATPGETFYAYLGFHWLWPITERLAFEPSGALAAYEKGEGKDLGGVLEFRSGFSFTYRFENGVGLSFGFSHLSHARLHGDRNPGANIFAIGCSYAF